MNHVISARARSDMLDIWGYIAESNITSADQTICRLRDTIENLATHPHMGRIRDDLGKQLYYFPYYFPCENYLIFYKHRQTDIRIVRILHAARYLQDLL